YQLNQEDCFCDSRITFTKIVESHDGSSATNNIEPKGQLKQDTEFVPKDLKFVAAHQARSRVQTYELGRFELDAESGQL
ncbi:hypothetical protein KCU98_g4868, partial [Aureobasidium melanogenum]